MQRADQPIILTGYSALNKLLGREVYTSHMQLGGPKVYIFLTIGSLDSPAHSELCRTCNFLPGLISKAS